MVGPLQGIAVLDLLPQGFGLSGRLLADLGASVVRVAADDDADARYDPRWREGSWVWDLGKRVVPAGDEEVPALAERADVVLRLAEQEALHAPRAVDVVVSPFGRVGPRAGWLASDLGVAASSGNVWATGDPDRPPVRCSAPLSLAHLGPEAVVAALSGLARGGPGQVDVSMSETYTMACLGGVSAGWQGDPGRRIGAAMGGTREIWPCADGWVSFGLRGGKARQPSLERLAALAAERGDTRLDGVDWASYNPAEAGAAFLATLTEVMAALFASLTVAELDRLATEDEVLVAPILDAPAVRRSAQLADRGFFVPVDGRPEVPRSIAAGRVVGGEWAWFGPPPAPDGSTVSSPVADAPWSGTRIIELGAGVAGPLVGRYFAEQGATVIRVESTTRPDFLRIYALGPANPHGLEGSPLFVWTNAGKLGVTLDLKVDEARRLARTLVAGANAVIENFTPGTMERLGLGFDELQRDHPDLVLLSMSFHGQTGPRRTEAGFGALGSALSGFNHLTGWPDREPIGPASTVTDSLAPRFGAAVLSAALLAQRRTGRGGHIDVGQLETAIYALSPWMAWCGEGHGWGREGNRTPAAAPHGIFRCAGEDRWVAVAVWSGPEWARLAEVIGWEGPDLSHLEERLSAVDRVEAAVEAWTSTRSPEEAAAELQASGVEAVPVADYCDVAADETLLARHHLVELDHDVLGPLVAERSGYRLDPDRGGYVCPSPSLGRDNRHVLTDLYGVSPVTVDRYVEDGVLR